MVSGSYRLWPVVRHVRGALLQITLPEAEQSVAIFRIAGTVPSRDQLRPMVEEMPHGFGIRPLANCGKVPEGNPSAEECLFIVT